MNTMPVREWMSKNPITITPQTTLPEAQRIMFENRIRRLPVVKGDKLVGIVTLGDLREARASDATTLSVYELNYLLDRLTAREFMSPDPVSISPDAMVGEAARLMVTRKIGGLPVVEDGKLVGIITETDFALMLMLQPEQVDAVSVS